MTGDKELIAAKRKLRELKKKQQANYERADSMLFAIRKALEESRTDQNKPTPRISLARLQREFREGHKAQ